MLSRGRPVLQPFPEQGRYFQAECVGIDAQRRQLECVVDKCQARTVLGPSPVASGVLGVHASVSSCCTQLFPDGLGCPARRDALLRMTVPHCLKYIWFTAPAGVQG